jgi:hypothetical protein
MGNERILGNVAHNVVSSTPHHWQTLSHNVVSSTPHH